MRPSNMIPSRFLIKFRVVLPSGPLNAKLSLCDPVSNWNSQREISPFLTMQTHSTNAK